MALVIGRIEVLAIPARRKDDSRSDAARTVLVGQFRSIFCVAGCEAFPVLQASMADACAIGLFGHGITRNHAEPRLEGRHLVVLRRIRHVVHRHATVLLEPHVGELGHTLKRTILGRFEVQRGSPVVAEVFAVCARRASRALGRIKDLWFHLQSVSEGLPYGSGSCYCKIEGVSSDNLMREWRGSLTGIYQRISSLNSELRAGEPEHILRRDALRQKRASDDGGPDHDDSGIASYWSVAKAIRSKLRRLLKSRTIHDVRSRGRVAISKYIRM